MHQPRLKNLETVLFERLSQLATHDVQCSMLRCKQPRQSFSGLSCQATNSAVNTAFRRLNASSPPSLRTGLCQMEIQNPSQCNPWRFCHSMHGGNSTAKGNAMPHFPPIQDTAIGSKPPPPPGSGWPHAAALTQQESKLQGHDWPGMCGDGSSS